MFCKEKLAILFCMLVALTFATKAPDDYEEPEQEKDVFVLTDDNFDDYIMYHDITLVEFYAPWCGHCKSLEPEYAEAAKQLKENTPIVHLAKVDATAHSKVAERFDVSGYPTLRFFINGKDYEYDGPRLTDGIVIHMKERADPKWMPPPPVPDAVLSLTSEDFHAVVDPEELILVEFYAPWCGHCKSLAPKYEAAAKILEKNDPPIRLVKVDATVASDLAKEYGVTGYPTMKIFRRGKVSDYKGPRDERGIVDYMKKQIGDGSTLLESLSDIKKKLLDDDVTIISFHSDKQDSRDITTYIAASNELRESYTLFHTYCEKARKFYGVKPGSVVVIHAERFHTKYEPKWHVLEMKDDTTSTDIESFISKHHIPLVGHFTHSNAERRYKNRPLCLVFYTVDWSFDHRKATQMWRNKIAAIANDYRDITFAILDDDANNQKLKDFGLDESGEEINIGILAEDDQRYPMEPMEEFDSDEIREFLDNFKNGKLTKLIKSQPAPKKQEAFVTVVGNTFKEIVQDPTKDVLLMLHAPWCAHCRNLMPIMKKLTETVSSEKNLVIAKIDANANDLPEGYEVSGYPTIYFAAADNKITPLKYLSARTHDNFVKFLKSHGVVSYLDEEKGKSEWEYYAEKADQEEKEKKEEEEKAKKEKKAKEEL